MSDTIDLFFLDLSVTREGDVYLVSEDGAEASIRRSRSGDAVYLMKIRTSPNQRGKGFASAILCSICEAADQHGVTLFLEVERQDDSGLTESELADWYWRFGFRGVATEMIREPKN